MNDIAAAKRTMKKSIKSLAVRKAEREKAKAYRRPAKTLRVGDMVICPDGRMGLIDVVALTNVQVTFGADGPFGAYDRKTLRRATMAEIKEAGLHGVGCNQTDE